jgi:hypothetical protein
MKRSVAEDQLLNLNTADVERAGAGRKAGYKFSLLLRKGRSDNLIASPPLAKDLVSALLEEASTKELLIQNDYQLDMNTKYQLAIKFVPKPLLTPEETEENNPVHNEAV